MAQDNRKTTKEERLPEAGPVDEGATQSAVCEGRRRAIKAGLIGAPLLLTLRSAPAWQDQTVAVGASGGSSSIAATTKSYLDPQPTDDQGIDG